MARNRRRWLPLRALIAGLAALGPIFAAAFVPSPARAALLGPDAGNGVLLDSLHAGGPTFEWLDISATGIPAGLGDDDSVSVTLPFAFELYGTPYLVWSLSSNGVLAAGGGGFSLYHNEPLPLDTVNTPLLAPYWDDLDPSSGGEVYYEVVGSAPERVFVAQWDQVPHYDHSDSVTFQVQLSEAGGDARFLYLEVEDDDHAFGAEASIGLQRDAATGLEYGFDEAVLGNELAIRAFQATLIGEAIYDEADGYSQTLGHLGTPSSVACPDCAYAFDVIQYTKDTDGTCVWCWALDDGAYSFGFVPFYPLDGGAGPVVVLYYYGYWWGMYYAYPGQDGHSLGFGIDAPGYLTFAGYWDLVGDDDRDGFPVPQDCDDTSALINPAVPDVCNGVDDDCDGVADGDGDGDGYGVCNDCDDLDPDINPGSVELCNLIDDDCDGLIDNDGDGDGFGPCDECAEGDPAIHPDAVEVCNGIDDDCDGFVDEDDDGDGYGACVDCDESDPSVHPGGVEVCNGIDDDCDGDVDDDLDGDGFGMCVDCDEGNPAVHPAAADPCNGVDDDCDGEVDGDQDGDGYGVCQDCDDSDASLNPADGDGDGVSTCTGDCDDGDPTVHPSAPEVCDGIDNDCDGQLPPSETDHDGDSWATCEGDCDDQDPHRFPGAPEHCNHVDDDCDDDIDEGLPLLTSYPDTDGDGYGDGSQPVHSCAIPASHTEDGGDCDDADPLTHPGADEVCDGEDDDCDGETDEGVMGLYFLDADGDGYGDPQIGREACAPPDGYVTSGTDCDDGNDQIHPDATEVCDDADNDCDGGADEDLTFTYYRDADGDGFGNAEVSTQACAASAEFVATSSDCDDGDPTVHPGATELCNGQDDDCDGLVDPGFDRDGDLHMDCAACSTHVGTDACDCDDTDPGRNPAAEEVPGDNLDNDCDGIIDDEEAGDALRGCACDQRPRTSTAATPASLGLTLLLVAGAIRRHRRTLRILGLTALVAVGLLATTGCEDPADSSWEGAPLSSPWGDLGAPIATTDALTAPTRWPAGAHVPDAAHVVSPRAVTLRPQSLLERDAVTLDVGEERVLQRERIVERGEDDFSWFGRVDGSPLSLVVIVVHDDRVHAKVIDPPRTYAIQPAGGGVHALFEVDTSVFPPSAEALPDDRPEPGGRFIPPPAPQVGGGWGPVIDLMVVYSDDAAAGAAAEGADIEDQIQLVVDETNQIYIDSGIGPQLNLVHTEEVSYAETADCSTDASRLLLTSDGFLDDVHETREQVVADLVALWVETYEITDDGNICGAGFLMTQVTTESASRAFSASGRHCALNDFTLAHELGHNMGAHHDRYVTAGAGAYDYSHGLVNVEDRWMTVMSYPDECSDAGVYCGIIPRFSNADATYGGDPLGVDQNQSDSADNRLTLNNTSATVAAFGESLLCDDADGDGFEDQDCGGDDCDDGDPGISPAAGEVCNGVDDDCDGHVDEGFDVDGDTYTTCEGDCDDGDASIHPGQSDDCDGEDEDCDGVVDEDATFFEYYADDDGDGYGDENDTEFDCDPPTGYVTNRLDCDDGDPAQYPGAAEVCNHEDDDCDEDIDEGVLTTYHGDADGDGYGHPWVTTEACDLPPDHALVAGDCDDQNPSIHPGAAELCDGIDNDCNGAVDDDNACGNPADGDFEDPVDNDGDGVTEIAGDCDDADWNTHPGAPELADGVDNDCDGEVDEGTLAGDADGDGVSPVDGDCDDGDAAVHPGADEVAGDYKDNDCDGWVDEPDPDVDADGDGFTEAEGDCQPLNPHTHPDAPEIPDDLLDNDCDGLVDEDVPVGWACAVVHEPAGARAPLALAGLGLLLGIRRARSRRQGRRVRRSSSGACIALSLAAGIIASAPAARADQPPDALGTGASPEDWARAGEEVARVNEQIAETGARWTAGITSMSLLPPGERSRMMGAELGPPYPAAEQGAAAGPPGALPTAFDWRNAAGDYTTPIRHQRQCGSCWAFATVAALEAVANIQAGQPALDPDLSEQMLLSCGDGDCVSGNLGDALTYLETTGVPGEACLPYEADDTVPCGDACAGWANGAWKAGSWFEVGSGQDAIKAQLLDGPVIAHFTVYTDLHHYHGGIYSPSTEDVEDTHAVLLVGWNDGDGAWIAKNSWGTNWGEDTYGVTGAPGWFRIAYGTCGIENHVYAVESVVEPSCADADGDGHMEAWCGGDDCDDGDAALNHHDDDGDGLTSCDGDCDDTDPLLNDDDDDGDGWSTCGGDCDDGDASLTAADHDGDGVSTCDGDCDDHDGDRFPGNAEVCNQVDDDCDGTPDQGLPLQAYWPDGDGDGYGEEGSATVPDCALFDGYADNDLDCDDGDPLIHPDGVEVCNYLDDDCNDAVDDGQDEEGNDVRPTFYFDGDLDGWGNLAAPTREFCTLADANEAVSGGLWVGLAGDCDDENDAFSPGTDEICDGLDNDCDGVADDGGACGDDPTDNDGDGVDEAGGDCDDGDWTVYPGAPEIPDGLDNDCDGEVDEGTLLEDSDGDGFSSLDGDCDDGDPAVFPGATEVFDGRDNDCDGRTDELDLAIEPAPGGSDCTCREAGAGPSPWLPAVLLGAVALGLRRRWRALLAAPLLLAAMATGCTRDFGIDYDDAPPTLMLLMPVDNQRFVLGRSTAAVAFVHDSVNALQGEPVTVTWQAEISLDDGSTATRTLATQEVDTTSGGSLVEVDLPDDLDLGTWTLVIRATDLEGQTSVDRAQVAVVPNESPAVRILGPAEGSVWGSTEPVLVLAEVADDHLPPGRLRVLLTLDATGEAFDLVADDQGHVFSVQRFLPPGPVTATFTVDDGGSAPVSDTVHFTVEEE